MDVAAAQPRFPHGLHGATTAYSSAIDTDLGEYEDLPDRHFWSIRQLLATSPDDSYRDTDGEEYGYGRGAPEWDYSGLRDPDADRRFQSAATYCLTCSDDSSEEDYDPTCECFVIVIGEGEDEGGGAGDTAPRNMVAVTPLAGATPPPPDATRTAQIAQIRELEAKLNA